MHCHTITVSIPDALRALANERHIAFIDSCGVSASILTWGTAPQLCTSLADIQVQQGDAIPASSPTWPQSITGGALIQMDYEFPVGAWAAPAAHAGRAQLWQLHKWACFDDDGCHLWADSADACAEMAAVLLGGDAAVESPVQTAPFTTHSPWTAAEYQQRIERIHAYIRSGDVYQVNLTMPFFNDIAGQQGADLDIFLHLRTHSPAPYAAFFRTNQRSFLSHSPERFLSVHQRQCSSHPIKGTCKRIPHHDQAQRAALRESLKDQAELAMIVDLVRNDLGRISLPGSVQVDPTIHIMDLPYVHHALAHISSTLPADIRHQDLFAACFPPGSITGAPKIRAMNIIQELEQHPRAGYCGCFGWLGNDSACELAVAIRSIQIDGERIRYDAGGGIIIDSQASSEWQELHDKTTAMQQSLEQRCAPLMEPKP